MNEKFLGWGIEIGLRGFLVDFELCESLRIIELEERRGECYVVIFLFFLGLSCRRKEFLNRLIRTLVGYDF